MYWSISLWVVASLGFIGLLFVWEFVRATAAVQKGAAHHEKELRRVAETKRQLRKERQKRAPARPQPTTTFPCPHCTKICGSRIGLYAHLRTHK